MAFSQVDPTVIIDSDSWAISMLVTATYSMGHTLISIEGMLEGVRLHRVAHYVPFVAHGQARPSMAELLAGKTFQLTQIKGQVKIKDSQRVTATIRDLVGSAFSGKTWKISRAVAQRVLRRIHDDSLRGLDLRAPTPRYDFRMVGQLKGLDSPTSSVLADGINCANWSQAMLIEAGIHDQGGLLIDFPRTQALAGSRSDWLTGLLIGLGAVDLLRQYLTA
jgi:hypothetical protein